MKIVAFVDQSIYAGSVIDHTAWLSRHRAASVELVQVISPNELAAAHVAPMHPSVSMAVDGIRMAAKVEKLMRLGVRQLETACDTLRAAGVHDVRARMLEGNIATSMLEAATNASVVVLGKRGESADLARLPLGSHVEGLVRGSRMPVLAVSRSFRPIERMLVGVDESSSATVRALTAGLLPPAFVELLHVGDTTLAMEAALKQAEAELTAAGLSVSSNVVTGEPRIAIAERVVLERFDLLAMGGFGSSRLRSMIVGSLTSELLRACQVPVLLC